MTAVVLALIEKEGLFFLQRRDLRAGILPGLWEFPGGKVESGETLPQAVARELLEELSVTVVESRAMAPIKGDPILHPFRVQVQGHPCTGLAWGWFTPEEMFRLPIPPRNLELVSSIQGGPASGGLP
jgi:8-oxo-dGTP pyrophosphatase MutT (NUDIX family)